MKNTTLTFCFLCCALLTFNLKAQSFSFSSKKPYADKAKISHEQKAVSTKEEMKEEVSRQIASVSEDEQKAELVKKDIENTVIFNKIKK